MLLHKTFYFNAPWRYKYVLWYAVKNKFGSFLRSIFLPKFKYPSEIEVSVISRYFTEKYRIFLKADRDKIDSWKETARGGSAGVLQHRGNSKLQEPDTPTLSLLIANIFTNFHEFTIFISSELCTIFICNVFQIQDLPILSFQGIILTFQMLNEK